MLLGSGCLEVMFLRSDAARKRLLGSDVAQKRLLGSRNLGDEMLRSTVCALGQDRA